MVGDLFQIEGEEVGQIIFQVNAVRVNEKIIGYRKWLTLAFRESLPIEYLNQSLTKV